MRNFCIFLQVCVVLNNWRSFTWLIIDWVSLRPMRSSAVCKYFPDLDCEGFRFCLLDTVPSVLGNLWHCLIDWYRKFIYYHREPKEIGRGVDICRYLTSITNSVFWLLMKICVVLWFLVFALTVSFGLEDTRNATPHSFTFKNDIFYWWLTGVFAWFFVS